MIRFRTASVIALLATVLFTSACANTIRGVGRDVQDSAEAVEDVAQ